MEAKLADDNIACPYMLVNTENTSNGIRILNLYFGD